MRKQNHFGRADSCATVRAAKELGLGTNALKSRQTPLTYLAIAIKGFCMGAADVVPGVSGGTMAFILGIYEELLASIRSFDLRFIRLISALKVRDAMDHASWRFLAALLAGILMAVFSLARILGWLLENRPVLIWSFFFGLILASMFTVSRHLKTWDLPVIIWMALGTAGTYFLVGMVPVTTPETPWFLFMSGAIAICAMILPGISGSFILVLLGKYAYVLAAVNNRNFLTLLVVASGAVAGLITFVRVLNWLLKRYYRFTIAVLTGLMLGSLRKVWPWKETMETMVDSRGHEIVISQANILPAHWNCEVTSALGLAILGFLVVFFLNFWAERNNAKSE